MSFLTSALGALPPERAHRLAIRALALSPFSAPARPDPALKTAAFGLTFANPLGLAAGFDKSAEAVDGLLGLGLGFLEVGTLTPKPQIGNPKPRLFRLTQDGAIVNRMGFNNDGYAVARARLLAAKRKGVVGVNIGPNKDARDRIADFVAGVEAFSDVAGYLAINISSPNTPGLRDLHARREFDALLAAVLQARERTAERPPILVKISPDLADNDLSDVLGIAMERKIDGLIVANTSVRRPATLRSSAALEPGGLSGRPLFDRSTRLVAQCYLRCEGRLPIIGVGGVDDAATAILKMEAGAALVQIYTGLIYRGPSLVGDILLGMRDRLQRAGLRSVGEWRGTRALELSRCSPP